MSTLPVFMNLQFKNKLKKPFGKEKLPGDEIRNKKKVAPQQEQPSLYETKLVFT